MRIFPIFPPTKHIYSFFRRKRRGFFPIGGIPRNHQSRLLALSTTGFFYQDKSKKMPEKLCRPRLVSNKFGEDCIEASAKRLLQDKCRAFEDRGSPLNQLRRIAAKTVRCRRKGVFAIR
jgi:type II restriction/modification system DNA methylase subunit YeeA